MTRSRLARRSALALVVIMASASVPLIASAHPSSYGSIAKVAPSPAPSPLNYQDLTDEQRYFVCNHGYCIIYKETNGVTTMGVVDYKLAPSAWRSQSQVTTAELFQRAAGGAQPHHTCQTPALSSETAITGWQESSTAGKPEPFYAYVPFQKAAAGLGDEPADWISYVQTLTAVDLSQVSDDPATALTQLKALCEGLPGGVFRPADAVQTAAEFVNSATTADAVAAAVAPLNDQITQLEESNTTLQDANGALRDNVKELRQKVKRLRAKIEKLRTR